MAQRDKPVPLPTPETQEYWDGAAVGELRVQRCNECGQLYFYPRKSCPFCLSTNVSWEVMSGRGRLHTYVINYRPAPGFEAEAPYAIAVVELEEGPKLMSNIVGIENTPENLVLDMPLEVVFEQQGEMTVPKFRPSGVSA